MLNEDYLDELPRIDKADIPEPVKFWALYAESYYEKFFQLIHSQGRLKKAFHRKMKHLAKDEERQALEFFYRIRRDELDGIPLWESLKPLFESPDGIEADNLEKVRPGRQYLSLKEFQFPFGYYDGDMRIGDIMGIHPAIRDQYPDISGKLPPDKKTFGRMDMNFAGRVWINDKIISLWDYPGTKEDLLHLLKDIEVEFKRRFGKPIFFNERDWYIEIIDKRLPRGRFSAEQQHQNTSKDWGDAQNAKLIKVGDYTGSGAWSDEKKGEEHILSPILKKKKKVPKGMGSNSASYRNRAAEKRLMYAESLNNGEKMGNLVPTFQEFLNEDLGNLRRFNLPQSLIDKILSQGGWGTAGPNSVIDTLEKPGNYKELLKDLKAGFKAGIISVDGEPTYFFYRSSERKFSMYNIPRIHAHNEQRKKEAIERDERDRKWKEERAAREAEKANENLNERRRGGYGGYDPGSEGSYSTQGLSEFIKGLEGEVKVELIRTDEVAVEKRQARNKARSGDYDPLDAPSYNSYSASASPSQTKRYKKWATKKKLEIDKQVDSKKDEIKNQILGNLDKALDEVIKDLRKGYSFQSDKKKIGEELMKGVDITAFKNLGDAYKQVEKSNLSPEDISSAANRVKKLGY